MKNVTISISEDSLEEVRRLAKMQQTTFNDLVRVWSDKYVAQQTAAERKRLRAAFEKTVKEFSFKSDRQYTHEEMNER